MYIQNLLLFPRLATEEKKTNFYRGMRISHEVRMVACLSKSLAQPEERYFEN